MGEIGLPELLVILGIALLIFGPRKIGELREKVSVKASVTSGTPCALPLLSQPLLSLPNRRQEARSLI